jgi:hypothetical protein
MATAFYSTRPDNGPTTLPPSVHVNLYPRGLPISELDFKDTRYPTLASPAQLNRRSSGMLLETSGRNPWENRPQTADSSIRSLPDTPGATWSNLQRRGEVEARERVGSPQPPQQFHMKQQAQQQQQQHQQQQYPFYQSAVSYALPPGPTHRAVEGYNLDDTSRVPSRASGDIKTAELDSARFVSGGRPLSSHRQQTPGEALSQERHFSVLPRHPPLPGAVAGASPVNSFNVNTPSHSPLPHSPTYNPSLGIPISPKPRAYAQHPTYVTPQSAPNPLNTVYSPAPPPQEEVCVECAMRDQDMADVDVTTPGIWERESDAAFNDLVRREQEDEAGGVVTLDPSRPRAKGGRLTEQNLKIWLSIVSVLVSA